MFFNWKFEINLREFPLEIDLNCLIWHWNVRFDCWSSIWLCFSFHWIVSICWWNLLFERWIQIFIWRLKKIEKKKRTKEKKNECMTTESYYDRKTTKRRHEQRRLNNNTKNKREKRIINAKKICIAKEYLCLLYDDKPIKVFEMETFKEKTKMFILRKNRRRRKKNQFLCSFFIIPIIFRQTSKIWITTKKKRIYS